MRIYYKKPYPTLKEVIGNKTYDYISGRTYNKNGEEEFLTAFRSVLGFLCLLERFAPLRSVDTRCRENERVIASEEWTTDDVQRGLTVVISHDFNDYTSEECAIGPFSKHNILYMDTRVEIVCSNGEAFSGDIRDGFITVNDGEISSAILLSPDQDCMENKVGNIIIPLSLVQTVKKKEEYRVPE